MKRLLWTLLIAFLIVSCNQTDVEPKTGTITGTVTMTMGEDTSGVANILFYLLDAEATIDTINYHNQQAFIDSVLTDSTGRYIFQDVQPGKYVVGPKYLSKYQITLKEGAEDEKVELGEGDTIVRNYDLKLNFTSAFMYKITYTLTNLKRDDYNSGIDVKVYRRNWIYFIPVMVFEASYIPKDKTDLGNGYFSCSFDRNFTNAFTLLVASLDNYISLDLFDSQGTAGAPDLLRESFQIYLPFTLPSDKVAVTFDAKSKEIKVEYK